MFPHFEMRLDAKEDKIPELQERNQTLANPEATVIIPDREETGTERSSKSSKLTYGTRRARSSAGGGPRGFDFECPAHQSEIPRVRDWGQQVKRRNRIQGTTPSCPPPLLSDSARQYPIRAGRRGLSSSSSLLPR